MIKFSLSRLKKEPIRLEGTESPEFLALSPDDAVQPAAPVSYQLLITDVSGGVLVQGSGKTRVSGICGRCLKPIEVDLAAENIELYVPVADSAGEELDISEDIREEILLNLPMNLLCREDCAGLCPECGADLNQTQCGCSRSSGGSLSWQALDDLKL